MGVIGTVAAVAGGAFLAGKAIKGIKDTWDSIPSSSYQPSASITAAHSKSNADILAEFKKDIRQKTEKREEEIIDYINGSLNVLLDSLEKVNGQNFGGKSLNINLQEIKGKNEDLKREVVGFIGNYMDSRMVASDHELAEILKIYNDKKRNQKFNAFYRKLQGQAETKLKCKIEITVHKQEEIVRKAIQARLAEVEKSMQEATRAYEEILQMKDEQDNAKIEEKQMEYCYKYELAEILLGQIES